VTRGKPLSIPLKPDFATALLQLRAKALILLLYDTGLRASEVCNARWKDITSHIIDREKTYVLRVIGAKTGRPREVMLSPDIWQAISEYREELKQPHGRGYKVKGIEPSWLFVSTRNLANPEPLTVSGLRGIFIRLEKECGIHSNPHKFRRSFATSWIENSDGQGIEVLMITGGWEDFRTLKEHYIQFRTPLIVRAARRNSPLSNNSRRQE
jgi:integrase